jgi:hypothetical protein
MKLDDAPMVVNISAASLLATSMVNRTGSNNMEELDVVKYHPFTAMD